MRMIAHHQPLARVQQQGEFGRQVVEARLVLQGVENLSSQRPGVEQLLRIDAGRRAQHQVTHVIAARVIRPQTGVQ